MEVFLALVIFGVLTVTPPQAVSNDLGKSLCPKHLRCDGGGSSGVSGSTGSASAGHGGHGGHK